MRQLTTDEYQIMNKSYSEWYDTDEGDDHFNSFMRGFKSGLEYQDKQIATLEAFIAGKITRDELEQVTK